MGWLVNTRSDNNDGAAGNIFEDHLGVSENNLMEADFEGFEVKTKQKLTSTSLMSLFTKKPSSTFDDSYMRDAWGIQDPDYPDLKTFNTTISATRWSLIYQEFKMKVSVDRKSKRIYILRADLDGNIIDRNVYWDFSDIINGAKKLENMFYVNAEVKVKNDRKYFLFTDAIVFTDYIGHTNFIDLVEEGIITYDNRLGIYRSGDKKGMAHNHGGGFRIKPKNIERLYRNKIEIKK